MSLQLSSKTEFSNIIFGYWQTHDRKTQREWAQVPLPCLPSLLGLGYCRARVHLSSRPGSLSLALYYLYDTHSGHPKRRRLAEFTCRVDFQPPPASSYGGLGPESELKPSDHGWATSPNCVHRTHHLQCAALRSRRSSAIAGVSTCNEESWSRRLSRASFR